MPLKFEHITFSAIPHHQFLFSGSVASEEADLEEAIRRSLLSDYDVVAHAEPDDESAERDAAEPEVIEISEDRIDDDDAGGSVKADRKVVALVTDSTVPG